MVLLLKSVKVISFDNYFYQLLLNIEFNQLIYFQNIFINRVFLGFYKKNK